jgi:ribosomal protein S18 acetylase RimI-like enzyme
MDVEERPASVLAVHALRSGLGRSWSNDGAVLVEPALVSGEPMAYGEPDAILELLEEADGWTCVEVASEVVDAMRDRFDARWGLAREVTDVIHVLDGPPVPHEHPLVRRLDDLDLDDPDGVLPERAVTGPAVALGRVFGAVDGRRLLGHGSSFASGERYADIGVHVAESARRQGIAVAAAASACRAVQADGLVPIWGCGAHNDASMATAAALGFREVERLVYLVRR